MKKTLIVLAFVMGVFFLTSTPSSAHGRYYFSFGFFPPPVIVAPPPVYLPPPVYWPPPVYYVPPPVYYEPRYYPPPPPPDDRVWVSGHSEWRKTPHGWEKVWVEGHWEYR